MRANTIEAFLEIIRAGLWEKEARLLPFGNVDYEEVLRLAEEQAVVGLVTAGLEHVKDVKVPQQILLQFIGLTLQLEKQNIAMNSFVAKLIKRLQENGIYALLVKGQGIAQCYERPLWRVNGDVDLFFDEDNYLKAKDFLVPISSLYKRQLEKEKHIELIIDSWSVELHGNLPSRLFKKIDNVLSVIQEDTFKNGNIRTWYNCGTNVDIPSSDNDVHFIFTHILKHFFHGGIGLRQICDWCRLLWTFREEIDRSLLESRLSQMGIMNEWKAFASFAVNKLGMPATEMALYPSEAQESKKFKKKGDLILEFVLETGNFGHNRDYSYYHKSSFVVRKFISFCRHTHDSLRLFLIFPFDSIKVWTGMCMTGVRIAIRTNKKNKQ